jgi:DNA polymerase III delta' subunit
MAQERRDPAETSPVFPQLRNQQHAKVVLEACLGRMRVPALLFAGPPGVGKRTMALLFAQAVNCRARADGAGLFGGPASVRPRPCGECSECRHIANLTHPDVKLVMPLKPESAGEDAASGAREDRRLVDETQARAGEFGLGRTRPESEAKWQISLQVIQWLRREMAYAPLQARRRVAIVVDADQMNPISANAFLKTLEEPQRDTTFILVAERSHKLLDTIRSRCQIVRFGHLDRDEIAAHLIGLDEIGSEAAAIAAEVCGGSLRRALAYCERPEQFLLPEAVEFLLLEQPSGRECLRLAEQAERSGVEALLDSLTFLHDQALRARLGIPTRFAQQNRQLVDRLRSLEVPDCRRRLEILLKARREFEYNVNRRLFAFSVLSGLTARPARVAAR